MLTLDSLWWEREWQATGARKKVSALHEEESRMGELRKRGEWIVEAQLELVHDKGFYT